MRIIVVIDVVVEVVQGQPAWIIVVRFGLFTNISVVIFFHLVDADFLMI